MTRRVASIRKPLVFRFLAIIAELHIELYDHAGKHDLQLVCSEEVAGTMARSLRVQARIGGQHTMHVFRVQTRYR